MQLKVVPCEVARKRNSGRGSYASQRSCKNTEQKFVLTALICIQSLLAHSLWRTREYEIAFALMPENIFWFFLLSLHSMKPVKTRGSKDITIAARPTASWVVMVNQGDRTLTVFLPKTRKRRKSQMRTSANRPYCKRFGRACLERNLQWLWCATCWIVFWCSYSPCY